MNYRTGTAPALPSIPHLYFMDPIEGRDRDNNKVLAEFAVNVENTFATKRAMLACHESQMEWVGKQHEIADYSAPWKAGRGDAENISVPPSRKASGSTGRIPIRRHPCCRTRWAKRSLQYADVGSTRTK